MLFLHTSTTITSATICTMATRWTTCFSNVLLGHCSIVPSLPLLSPAPPSAPLFLSPTSPLFPTPLSLSLLAPQKPSNLALPWRILSKRQEIERNPSKIWTCNIDPCTKKLRSMQGFLRAQARSPPVGGHQWTSNTSPGGPRPSQDHY